MPIVRIATFLLTLVTAGCASAGRVPALPLGDPADPEAAPGMAATRPELLDATPVATPAPTPSPAGHAHHHHEAGDVP